VDAAGRAAALALDCWQGAQAAAHGGAGQGLAEAPSGAIPPRFDSGAARGAGGDCPPWVLSLEAETGEGLLQDSLWPHCACWPWASAVAEKTCSSSKEELLCMAQGGLADACGCLGCSENQELLWHMRRLVPAGGASLAARAGLSDQPAVVNTALLPAVLLLSR
jgi:hypothetical protein